MEGKTQETAAAVAGMCVRSARKWQSGPLPSETKQERWWRTRPDPFDGVWEEEIEPLLCGDPRGKLKACCLIEERYQNLDTWGDYQPSLIPAWPGFAEWLHRPQRNQTLRQP